MYPENWSQSQNKEQTSWSFLARRIRKIKDVILSVISWESNKEILSPMKAKDLVLYNGKTLRQKTISCDEIMSIGDVIQTTFYDCNFIGETIKRVDFSWSVFNNCIFEFFDIDECKCKT